MSSTVRYCRLDPRRNPTLLDATATCYREVFADEPWNEWKKCPLCQAKWGTKQNQEIEEIAGLHCGVPLVDYWPHEKVRSGMLEEIGPGSSCWLALVDQRVIGFTWGYPMMLEELDKHLNLSGTAQALADRFGDASARFAYQDELGVVSEYRGKKIASQLVARRLDDFITEGLTLGVVRTKTNPPTVTYLWYTQLGYEVIREYGDSDGRVVMARSLS